MLVGACTLLIIMAFKTLLKFSFDVLLMKKVLLRYRVATGIFYLGRSIALMFESVTSLPKSAV